MSAGDYCLGPLVSGSGSIPSSVHLARERRGQGRTVVVKKYFVDVCEEGQGLSHPKDNDPTPHLRHEVAMLRQLSHQNIQTCMASLVSGCEVWLVSPLCTFGSVRDLLASQWQYGLPELACATLSKDIIAGLQYIHSQGVVHRSLRCSHILVTSAGTAVLSGFRYSTGLGSTGEHLPNLYSFPLHGVTTNLCWLAPEILGQNLVGYNETSDIYSLAVCLCEMANGVVPFSDLPPTLLLLEKLRGSTPRLMDCSTLASLGQAESEAELNQHGQGLAGDSGVGDSVASCKVEGRDRSVYLERAFSSPFHALVGVCSSLEPLSRPSAQELSSHPWLRQLRKSNSNLLTLLHPLQGLAAGEEEDEESEAEFLLSRDLSKVSLRQNQEEMEGEIQDMAWDFE